MSMMSRPAASCRMSLGFSSSRFARPVFWTAGCEGVAVLRYCERQNSSSVMVPERTRRLYSSWRSLGMLQVKEVMVNVLITPTCWTASSAEMCSPYRSCRFPLLCHTAGGVHLQNPVTLNPKKLNPNTLNPNHIFKHAAAACMHQRPDHALHVHVAG